MCLSCGCHRPKKRHDDPRHITIVDLNGAAKAAGISPREAAENVLGGVEHALAKGLPSEPAPAGTMLKSDDEKRVALFVAYPANKPDVGTALDGFRDFASKGVIESAAWNWLARGGHLGLWHERNADDLYEVVASDLHHGPDWVLKATDGSEQRIVDGDWLVTVRAKTPEAWALIKSGVIGGASPQGAAKRRTPTPEALAGLRG